MRTPNYEHLANKVIERMFDVRTGFADFIGAEMGKLTTIVVYFWAAAATGDHAGQNGLRSKLVAGFINQYETNTGTFGASEIETDFVIAIQDVITDELVRPRPLARIELTPDQTSELLTYVYGQIAFHLVQMASHPTEETIKLRNMAEYVSDTYKKVMVQLNGDDFMGSPYSDFQTQAVPKAVEFARQLVNKVN